MEAGETPPMEAKTEAGTAEDALLPSRAYSGPKKRYQELQSINNDGSKVVGARKDDDRMGAGLGRQRIDNVDDRTPWSVTSLKGPINKLKRKSSPTSGLSPSDRMIAIGLAVTPTSMDERTASPEAVRRKPSNLHIHQNSNELVQPVTPSIVVTPAKDEAPWSATCDDLPAPNRARPASSIYSQATHRARAATQPLEMPPMPTLPDTTLYQKLRNASSPQIKSRENKPSERAISTCTVFEDEAPILGPRGRSDSAVPQLRLLPRSSMDSISTRHRSQGWWNYILSPLFAKPRSPAFPTNDDDRQVSELNSPHSSDVTRIGEDIDEDTQDKKDAFSPPMRDSAGSDRTHTSIWTDGSHLEEERNAFSPAFYDPTDSTEVPMNPSRDRGMSESPIILSPEGFGTAAEYYQACWHDQHSPTPFFECQNHVCPPFLDSRLKEERIVIDGNLKPPEAMLAASRGIAESEHESPKHPHFQQTPANRFSAAFKQAVTPKARPLSEETIIEDLDTTPYVEEAHAAPMVRAQVPVPTPHTQAVEPIGEAFNELDEPAKPGNPVLASPKQLPKPVVEGPKLAVEGPEPAVEGPEPAVEGPQPPVEGPQPAVEGPQPARGLAAEPAPPAVAKAPQRKIVAVMPPEPIQAAQQMPKSPEPLSPAAQRELASEVSAPAKSILPTTRKKPEMAEALPLELAPRAAPPPLEYQRNASFDDLPHPGDQRPVYVVNDYHGNYPRRHDQVQSNISTGLYPPPRDRSTVDENREKLYHSRLTDMNEKKKPRSKQGGSSKARNCFSATKSSDKKKKWLLISIAIALVLMIILIIALAMTLTWKGDKMPVQTQWLNISGFPPIPTGISTIVQPDAAYEQSSCVSPTTMWSCALPKEEHASVAPNGPDQPNFRVEIRFQNGTNVSSGINASLHKRFADYAPNAVSASALIKHQLLRLRDTFSSGLFVPSPAPPSLEDQTFLGKSTDNITGPFYGEVTPFFMSFQSANKLSRRLLKRDGLQNSTDNSSAPLPDLGSAIPAPDSNPDGTAAPANLLPFPSSQPLRLFDRGRPTEHYGFYTYFDRSIFLASNAVLNSTIEAVGNVPGDEDGGAAETAATVRCTWRQTRFLVQIWTNLGGAASLLPSNSTAKNTTTSHPKNLTESSANDFDRPGSFPYPVSITLDRHGGNIETKEIYCYGVNNRQRIVASEKQLQLEDRAFGGKLINPALGPFGQVNVSTSEGGPGGIDGGTGGCGCVWRNWEGAQ